jgi:hypothetical protein
MNLATLALSLRATTVTTRAHGLRVIDPENGAVLLDTTVALGSECAARRVTRNVARLWAAGARVEVETSRGWQERDVIVANDGLPYLRSAGWSDRAKVAKYLAALAPTVAARLAA